MTQFVIVGDVAINLSLVKCIQRYTTTTDDQKSEQAQALWHYITQEVAHEKIP